MKDYLDGAIGRFTPEGSASKKGSAKAKPDDGFYRLPRPGLLWGDSDEEPLAAAGGKTRPASVGTARRQAPEASVTGQPVLPYSIAAAETTD